MGEIWKNINNYKGLYQVSNLGRVKSLERIVVCNQGKRVVKEKILKYNLDRYGYLSVVLCINGLCKRYTVHRLVYETFRGKAPYWMQVNHINEDKTDNRLCNLNIMTAKQNSNWGTRNERAGVNISLSKKAKNYGYFEKRP